MNLIIDKIWIYNWIDFGRGIAILVVIIMVYTGQVFTDSNNLKRFTDSVSQGVDSK